MLAVMLGLAALALPRLAFDDDINRAFLSNDAASGAERAFEAGRGAATAEFLVLAEADAPFDAAAYARLRDFALDLALDDGVAGVASPFALRLPGGGPALGDDLSPQAVDRGLAAFAALGTGLPIGVTPDRRAMVIGVAVDPAVVPPRTALARLRAEAAAVAAPGLTLGVTGEEAIAADIVAGLKRDLVRLNAVGAVVIAALAFWVLGGWRPTVIAVVPALLGAVAALGLFAGLGYPVTVINNVIPILVLVLGVADSIHLTAAFMAETGPPERRLERVMRETGPACALTAITTAVAFASLGATGNAQLTEFAVLGAAGMAVSFIVVTLAFAILARWLGPGAGAVRPMRVAVPSGLAGFVIRRTRALVLGGTALLALCAVLATGLRPWFPLEDNLPAGSVTRAVDDRLAADFGGAFRLWVEVDTGGPNALAIPAGWARFRGVVEAVEAAAPGYPVTSLAALARWQGTPGAAPPESLLADLPAALAADLASPDGTRTRILVAMPEPMRDAATLAAYDRIEAAALGAGALRVAGLPAVMRHGAVRLIRQLGLGLVSACLLGVGVIALAFRRAALLWVLPLPNVLPVALTGAGLVLVDSGHVSPVAVLSLTIAFGIAVDDSVHYINRFQRARRDGLAPDASHRAALGDVGRVMAVTTLLISAGLAVALTSAFFPVRLFGGLMIVTFAAALVADLTLLPALMRLGGYR